MTAADDAFQHAQRLIEKARTNADVGLNLNTPETRALTTLPDEIATLTNLQTLWLNNTQVGDAVIAKIATLTNLDTLRLDNTQVGDVGIDKIAALTNLQRLYLKNTQVGDVGIDKIATLTNLHILSLNNTQVGDAGITKIATLTNLQKLYLNNTQVGDASIAKIATLTNLQSLDLNNTQVGDLRPLTGLQNLLENDRVYGGLHFQNTPACDLDAQLKELSEIEDDDERTRKTFDYLNSLTHWPPRKPLKTPQQIPAPIQAEIINDQLVEHIPDIPLRDDIAHRARIAWAILQELHNDASQTLSKDNLPNLQRALTAFGRALGDSFETTNQIGLGTHGQRIIEIAKDAGDMLMDDAAGELRGFAAAIALHLKRFPEWIAYLEEDIAQDSTPPLASVDKELRNISDSFADTDFIAPMLAEKFDDLIDAANDGDIPAPLAKKGVLNSLSNMLSPLAKVVLKSVKATGKHLVLPAVQATLGTGLTVAIGDLLLNNGQILLALAHKYPAVLGWLEAVLIALR